MSYQPYLKGSTVSLLNSALDWVLLCLDASVNVMPLEGSNHNPRDSDKRTVHTPMVGQGRTRASVIGPNCVCNL